MKDMEKVFSGKAKYDSLTGKSVIDSTTSQCDPYINKMLGINSENYIDALLSKTIFSFKINKLSTTDNIFNGKSNDILYLGTLIKIYHLVISFALSQRIFNMKANKWSN